MAQAVSLRFPHVCVTTLSTGGGYAAPIRTYMNIYVYTCMESLQGVEMLKCAGAFDLKIYK